MEMMNIAIEGASDYKGMMKKIQDDIDNQRALLLQAGFTCRDVDETALPNSDRNPGENRARMKRERRDAKARTAAQRCK